MTRKYDYIGDDEIVVPELTGQIPEGLVKPGDRIEIEGEIDHPLFKAATGKRATNVTKAGKPRKRAANKVDADEKDDEPSALPSVLPGQPTVTTDVPPPPAEPEV